MTVKLLAQDEELYVFAQSQDRLDKERAMRRRQLKALWKRLGQLTRLSLLDAGIRLFFGRNRPPRRLNKGTARPKEL